MAKRSKANIVLRKKGGTAVPITAFDAEQFDKLPEGSEFDLVLRAQRSLPQNRYYWQILQGVVDATDLWPTKNHLHDALLRDLGYISVSFDMRGQPYILRDSAAFDEMKPPEFNEYFERAMSRLAEAVGFDPMQVLGEQRAA